jgi:hypothetical protein
MHGIWVLCQSLSAGVALPFLTAIRAHVLIKRRAGDMQALTDLLNRYLLVCLPAWQPFPLASTGRGSPG